MYTASSRTDKQLGRWESDETKEANNEARSKDMAINTYLNDTAGCVKVKEHAWQR